MEFGGGGAGALGVTRERNWDLVPDNSCVLSATGEVVDTGVGVMPALDKAKQEAGMMTSSQEAEAAAAGAGGVATTVGGIGLSEGVLPAYPGAAAGEVGFAGGNGEEAARLGNRSQSSDEYYDEPEEAKYMAGRDELDSSLGEREEACVASFGSRKSVFSILVRNHTHKHNTYSC